MTYQVRKPEGRSIEPTVAVIDSQSVTTIETAKVETRGDDVQKATKGCQRHLLVDTLGLINAVTVTAANVTDREVASLWFEQIRASFPSPEGIRADQADSGEEYTLGMKPSLSSTVGNSEA